MPTYEGTTSFLRDYQRLTPEQQAAFITARRHLVDDLRAARGLRKGLRVKRVRRVSGEVWEMTWAPDGRATFEYGPERRPGEPHIVWRRIGTHDIFRNP